MRTLLRKYPDCGTSAATCCRLRGRQMDALWSLRFTRSVHCSQPQTGTRSVILRHACHNFRCSVQSGWLRPDRSPPCYVWLGSNLPPALLSPLPISKSCAGGAIMWQDKDMATIPILPSLHSLILNVCGHLSSRALAQPGTSNVLCRGNLLRQIASPSTLGPLVWEFWFAHRPSRAVRSARTCFTSQSGS